MSEELFVGLDKNTKKKVYIPIFHMAATGQTQLSGKTTITKTLARQAVEKYGYKVLVFDTKENMEDFRAFGEEIPVCMRETTDSLILIGLAEAIFGRRLTQYYSALSWITEDAKTLQDVIDRAKEKEETSRGWFKGACRTLWDLLDRLQRQLAKTETVPELELPYDINRMVLNYFPRQSQQLFIKYALQDALRKYGKKLIIILDEAFKFIPQRYGSACKKEVQDVITQGAGTQLLIWITTQFLAPTDKDPLKACAVRLLGTQDHDTEAEHTIDLIPRAKQRGFDKDTVMTLPLGHFVVITKKFAKLTYALPVGVPLEVGEKVVSGELTPEYVRDNLLKKKEVDEEMVYKEKFEELERRFEKLQKEKDELEILYMEAKEEMAEPEERRVREQLEKRVADLEDRLEKLKKERDALKKNGEKTGELEKKLSDVEEQHTKAVELVNELKKKLAAFEYYEEALIGLLQPTLVKILKEIPVARTADVPSPKSLSVLKNQVKDLQEDYALLENKLQDIIPKTSELTGPSEISVTTEQPTLTVKRIRHPLTIFQESLEGRIALVYAEGLLPEEKFTTRQLNKIMTERYGRKEAYANFKKVLPRFVFWGFFEKVQSGARWDYRVKMNPEDAKAKGLLKVEE